MSSHWNLFTPTSRIEETKKETPRSLQTGMISESESIISKGPEKFFERKKRKFQDMERGQTAMKKGGFAPVQSLSSVGSEPLKMKGVDQISNIPEDKRTFKPSVSVSKDFSKVSRSETVKVLAAEAIEKYLYMDEKLVDTDRNIGSSTVVSSKIYIFNEFKFLNKI